MNESHKIREDHQSPESIESWGWKYHHIGIPTDKIMVGEKYIPHLKLYVSGFNTSPFGVEWMRFEDDCPIDKMIQKIPHIAFEVADLDYELANRNLKILSKPDSPSIGVRVAMIEHNGMPVELIEFERNK